MQLQLVVMQPFPQPKLDSTFCLLADTKQINSLFIIALFDAFVIGRVVYPENTLDWDTLKYGEKNNNKFYRQVPGYNIAVVLEKVCSVYSSAGSIESTIINMTNFFLKERVEKDLKKHLQWKVGLKPITI